MKPLPAVLFMTSRKIGAESKETRTTLLEDRIDRWGLFENNPSGRL
jgi:hypothetical protein